MDNNLDNNVSKMNDFERLNLKKMINEGNVEDNTNYIRSLKHSNPIAEDILKIQELKQQNPFIDITTTEFNDLCIEKCSFLYNNYTDIFNRVVRGELNLKIFSQFLYVLKQIEEDKLNFHDASFTIGKLLKEMYVDSALRRVNTKDNENSNADLKNDTTTQYIKPKDISWLDYKTKKCI